MTTLDEQIEWIGTRLLMPIEQRDWRVLGAILATLRAVKAGQQAEPVAWKVTQGARTFYVSPEEFVRLSIDNGSMVPLYATPQPAQQAEPVAWWKDQPMPLDLSHEPADFAEAKEMLKRVRDHVAATPKPAPGWVLVPKEPTEAMLQAAHEVDREYTERNFGDVMTVRQGGYEHYIAMIAAAPAAPESCVSAEQAHKDNEAMGAILDWFETLDKILPESKK